MYYFLRNGKKMYISIVKLPVYKAGQRIDAIDIFHDKIYT